MFAVDILREVEDAVVFKNGDVVKFALNLLKSGYYCDCPWSKNKNEFIILLKTYAKARCFFTKRRRRGNRDMGASEVDVTFLRQKLSLIWPCENCIVRFNPTGRKRK